MKPTSKHPHPIPAETPGWQVSEKAFNNSQLVILLLLLVCMALHLYFCFFYN